MGITDSEQVARVLAEEFYIGYNQGFCSAIGYVFKGSVEHLVDRNWRSFIDKAGKLKEMLK